MKKFAIILILSIPLYASQFKEVIKEALKSYVFVDSSGSGVLISGDGYIITNDHVAGNAATWRVRTYDGKMHFADLIGTDPYGDISLLKIRNIKDLPHIQIGNSDKLRAGQRVIALGNPFGLGDLDEKPTVTTGIISALHRFHFNYTDAIMTDAPLNPGNSGGPLITMDGKLVGINGQIDNRFEMRMSSGIGYAVSSNQIKRFLPKLKKANGGFLYHGDFGGIRLPRITAENKKPTILYLRKASGLYTSGVRKGDTITKINKYPVTTSSRLIGLIRSYPAYSVVDVEVMRKQKKLQFPVILSRFPLRGKPHIEVTFYPSSGFKKYQAQSLQVDTVMAKTAADIAGVKSGDIILSFAGRKITPELMTRTPNYLNLLFSLYGKGLGAITELTIIRDGKEKTLVITIPKNATDFGINLRKFSSKIYTKSKQKNLTILNVQKGMFADKGGLRRGDVLLSINKYKLRNKRAYYIMMSRLRPGEKIDLKILRDGKIKNLKITVGLARIH